MSANVPEPLRQLPPLVRHAFGLATSKLLAWGRLTPFALLDGGAGDVPQTLELASQGPDRQAVVARVVNAIAFTPVAAACLAYEAYAAQRGGRFVVEMRPRPGHRRGQLVLQYETPGQLRLWVAELRRAGRPGEPLDMTFPREVVVNQAESRGNLCQLFRTEKVGEAVRVN